MAEDKKKFRFCVDLPMCKQNWERSAELFKNTVNKTYEKLTPDEINELIRIVKTSRDENAVQRATCEILNSIQPLIMSLAMEHCHTNDFMDYVQESNIVAMKCIRKYEPDNEYQCTFVSYVTSAILFKYDSISDEYKNIVPRNLNGCDMTKVNRFIERIVAKYGRDATKEEIVEFCAKNGITYKEGMDSPGCSVSIDTNIVDSDVPASETGMYGSSINDCVKDLHEYDLISVLTNIKRILDEYSNKINKKIVRESFLRDINILFEYYGACGYEKKSVFVLAHEYNLTESRINTIVRDMPVKIREYLEKKQI